MAFSLSIRGMCAAPSAVVPADGTCAATWRERRLRYVPDLWAALGQATACRTAITCGESSLARRDHRVGASHRVALPRVVSGVAAYREQTVAEAKGQASRFNQVYEQYKKAPDVTRKRIYLETMERVLGGTNKTIIDTGGQSSPGVVLTQQQQPAGGNQ